MLTESNESIVLLPVHPHYVLEILAGRKTVEFRRRVPRRRPSWLYLYATSPISAILGFVEVVDLVQEAPSVLWERYSNAGSIDKHSFDTYFSDSCEGYAYLLGDSYEFSESKRIQSVPSVSAVPQSFKYLTEVDVTFLADTCDLRLP